ncbi:MAG: cytochrome c3 family protein [Sedimentisphaerales bacterium]
MSEKFSNKLVMLLISGLISSGLAVEKPTSRQETCVTEECHADYSKKAYVHGPVAVGECESCHKSVNDKEHTFGPKRKGPDLCQYCHLDKTIRKNLHNPSEEDNCIQCHDPHSSDSKLFLYSCGECHQVTIGMKFLHGPVEAGECTACHDPHGSDYENLLPTEPNEHCFSCHEVTKNELKKFEFIHEPMKGQCAECHNVHGANNAKMLIDEVPELCYPCHEDIKKMVETAKYQHSVVTEKGGCMHCHTPHASTVKYGLKAAPIELCMTCHDKPIDINKDEVLEAFTAEIENKKFLHGPIAQKDCEGCHVSHGSEHFRLLEKEYPPQFYAPFSEENYELCFSCHSESMVLTKQTFDLTDFRNGSLNLHFLHVNKERRGRTCRACHATHASNQPRHIRKSVPYGRWDLPIQFEKTETGGSCKPGCHLPFAYDRQTPVVYERPQPASMKVNLESRQEF